MSNRDVTIATVKDGMYETASEQQVLEVGQWEMALWEEEGSTVLSMVFCWETVDSGTYVNVILAHITNLNTAADSLHPVMAAVCSFFNRLMLPATIQS